MRHPSKLAVILTYLITLLLVIVISSSAGCRKKDSQPTNGSNADDRPLATVKPLLFLTGNDSQVRKPAYHLISSRDEWEKVWRAHQGETRCPIGEIDFEKCMVIAIFQGSGQSGGLGIDSITEAADRITLRFHDLPYGIALRPDEDPPDDRAYAFVVLPSTKKPVILEEEVVSSFDKATGEDRTPVWKERARLKHAASSNKP